MEQTPTRIALIGIVVENSDSVEQLNSLLSQYGNYIIGRMGIPYREKSLSIISIAMDAPNNVISALSGKIGMLPGISSKTILCKDNFRGTLRKAVFSMNKIAEQTLITLIDQLRDTHLLSKEEWMFLIENRTRDVSEYLFSQAREVRHQHYGHDV